MAQRTKEEFLDEMKAAGHRPEIIGLVSSLWGQEVDRSAFITEYKKAREGMPRSSPSKARQLYDFLVKYGAIRSNEQ